MNTGANSKLNLSLIQVVIIGVAYMTPMTVFDTFGIVSGVTEGRVPLTYLLALIAILFTALSYGRLVRLYPSSGSAYTYTKRIGGDKLGFLVGWSSLLDYILLPMINSLLAGIYLGSLLPEVPVWISILLFTGLVTYINCCRIRVLANTNYLFVGLPMILMALFIYLVVRDLHNAQGWDRVLTLKPLFNGDSSLIPLISGAAILCFSFLGFDAVTTLSGETNNPAQVIPKAIFLTALSGGAIFFVAAWFIQLYYPDNSQFKNPTEALPEIVLYVGGRLFQTLFLIAMLFNTFASALASHASASRLLMIMSKNNVKASAIFGYINPKTHSPLYAVLFIGLISVSSIFFNLDTGVSLISFGALVAFSAVNLMVVVKFAYQEKQLAGIKKVIFNLILPLAGLCSIGWMWLNLDREAFTLGAVWALLGIGWMVYRHYLNKRIIVTES